jgi:hypothetical protein
MKANEGRTIEIRARENYTGFGVYFSGYARPMLVAPTLEQARQLAAIVAGKELKIVEVLR